VTARCRGSAAARPSGDPSSFIATRAAGSRAEDRAVRIPEGRLDST